MTAKKDETKRTKPWFFGFRTAPTGRTKCSVCKQPVEKGSIEVTLQFWGGQFPGHFRFHEKCLKEEVNGGLKAFRERLGIKS